MRRAPDNANNPLVHPALHHGAVAVTVCLGPSGDEAWQEEWHVLAGESTWDVAWLLSLSRNIGALTGISNVGRRGPKRGLDVLDVLVSVAAGVASSAAWDATKAVGAALARHVVKVPVAPLTDSEVVARARSLVADRYNENADALVIELVDVTAGNTAEVTLTGAKWDYNCWFELHDELVTVSRVRRIRRR